MKTFYDLISNTASVITPSSLLLDPDLLIIPTRCASSIIYM